MNGKANAALVHLGIGLGAIFVNHDIDVLIAAWWQEPASIITFTDEKDRSDVHNSSLSQFNCDEGPRYSRLHKALHFCSQLTHSIRRGPNCNREESIKAQLRQLCCYVNVLHSRWLLAGGKQQSLHKPILATTVGCCWPCLLHICLEFGLVPLDEALHEGLQEERKTESIVVLTTTHRTFFPCPSSIGTGISSMSAK